MGTPPTGRYRTTFVVLAALVVVWGIFGALDVRNVPYAGFLDDGNNTVTQVRAGSPAEAAGMLAGDRYRSVDGVSVEDTKAIVRQPRRSLGETVTFVVDRNGETVNLDVQLTGLPTSQKLLTHGAALVGLCFLAFGLWAYSSVASRGTTLLAVLGLLFGPAMVSSPYFASPMLRTLTGAVITFAVVMGFAVLMHFLIVVPKQKAFAQRRGVTGWVYGPAAVVGLLLVGFALVQPNATSAINVLLRTLVGLFVVVYFGLSVVAMLHSFSKATSADRVASGLNLMLVGTVLGLGPFLIATLSGTLAPQVVLPGSQYYFLTLALIPISFALAAVKNARATMVAESSGSSEGATM